MKFYNTEWVFLVKVRLMVNGAELKTPTWSSSENFDACYTHLEKFIKAHTSPDDQIIKHIISTSQKEYPVTEWSMV